MVRFPWPTLLDRWCMITLDGGVCQAEQCYTVTPLKIPLDSRTADVVLLSAAAAVTGYFCIGQ